MDITSIKKRFPVFQNYPELVYLDNAATSQKPKEVIDAMSKFYETSNANIHRGVYQLSETATEQYEEVRTKVQKFINARSSEEIIFTRGTTESLNAVAYTWGEQNIREGDEIVVSLLEHHSNFVPWQQLAKRKKAKFRLMPLTQEGLITAEALEQTISAKTRLVAVTHVSNVLGVITPLEEIIKKAHSVGARVIVDAAQSIAHFPVDVRALDCDWLAFSGHKMYGPTGVGVLYGKKELLAAMPPFLFGGGMIYEVKTEDTTWAELPAKFEAGTPPIAEVIGLGKAVDFLQEIGRDTIEKHEKEIGEYAFSKFQHLPYLTIFGPKNSTAAHGAISFLVKGIHAHDVATLADEKNVCIRVGHHCAQPLMSFFQVPATCRVSFGIYNTKEDIDTLISALAYAQTVFSS